MAVELNHTIVPAADPQASAQFLADILGVSVDPPLSHFTPVTLANGVSLDFDHADHINEHHYAFQLNDDEFEAAFARIKDQGLTYYADPACRQPGQVYASKNGRRGKAYRQPVSYVRDGPQAARFIPIPRRTDGRLDPDVDNALRYGFCTVRWHLADPA